MGQVQCKGLFYFNPCKVGMPFFFLTNEETAFQKRSYNRSKLTALENKPMVARWERG